MATFLAYTSPARGHLYPIVPTLLELMRRDHQVHVRTLSSEVDALGEIGVHAAPISPEIESIGLADWEAATPEEGLAGVLRTFGERSNHEMPDLQKAIDEVEPDVLLVDKVTPGAIAVAERSALPWAQWIPFFEHNSVDPGSFPEIRSMPYSLHPSGREVINRPREALGLPTVDDASTFWPADRYLYLTAEPFEYPGLSLPPHFKVVGAGIWEPPTQVPDWLEGLADPLVLVTASSEFQCDDVLVRTALQAFRSEDVRVIASTAAHDPGDFDVPPNARVERWVPHNAVLERAVCVVCHGGMGITQKALAAGVPVCIVPFGRDQFEVAGRVAAVGAGVFLPPNELTPQSLLRAVATARGKRGEARQVRDGFIAAGGPRRAADELEELIGSAQVRTTQVEGRTWAIR